MEIVNRHPEETRQIMLRTLSGYVRKPSRWSEIGDPIPLQLLLDLKQYTSESLGIWKTPAETFSKTPEEQVFLVGHDGGLYLVNREGFDYARYVRYVGAILPTPTK